MARAETTSTHELWTLLFEAPTLDAYLEKCSGDVLPAFSDYIAQLAAERNLTRKMVISVAGLERAFGHRLFNGTRNPSRDTVLQLAFGLGLDCNETQQLLTVAQMSMLHPKVKRDAVIAFCLHNGIPLMDAQLLLYENDLPLLGGAKRAQFDGRS